MTTTTASSAPGRVRCSVEQGVGWIVLDNPRKHNAMSLAMWDQVVGGLATFRQDDSVRCVVIRGEGDRAFCAGADIDEKQGATPEQTAADTRRSLGGIEKVHDFPKPVIAMISGYCMGGGMALALACDLRLASEQSTFGIPAAKLGIAYVYTAVKRLTELVGPGWARQILYTADRVTAQQALRIGIVNELIEPARLQEYVTGMAGRIAANAPLSIDAAKQAVAVALSDPPGRDLAGCDERVRVCQASADFEEGRLAFKEKRTPVFQGR